MNTRAISGWDGNESLIRGSVLEFRPTSTVSVACGWQAVFDEWMFNPFTAARVLSGDRVVEREKINRTR